MLRTFIIIWGCLWVIPFYLSAQQIRVDDFNRLKKPFLGAQTYETDKQFALLDLYTQETGFEFLIGQQPVQAQEGDGFLTLSLPDKTRFFTVKHPEYGQLIWKIPEELRRKKRYQAYLFTDSPDKEYKVKKQWAIFYVQPEHAMVTIDSTLYRTMDGTVQAYLPLGKHPVKVESPFYETQEDTICVEDDQRLEKRIHLQPYYSYLVVNSYMPNAEIRLDGQFIGMKEAQSKRLLPGTYTLTVQQDSLLFYQESIHLDVAERRIIDLKKIFASSMVVPSETVSEDSSFPQASSIPQGFRPVVVSPPVPRPDSLHIQAFDEDTEIWVNREKVAQGSWKEELPPGLHAVSTRKDGVESPTQYIQIGDGKVQHIKMSTPYAKYGWVNVSCNVVDAEVWLDGTLVGKTPCILSPLSTYKKYTIKLKKDGYKEVETTVSLKNNDMQNIQLKLKKK